MGLHARGPNRIAAPIMKTKLLLAALALAPVAATVRAAEPATGHVLLLNTERTLEGDITREGDHYVVKRQVGSVNWPADQVKRLCGDMTEAYAFLRGQSNLDDPDERLRLAQWCHVRGLKAEATTEVRAALALRPRDERCQQLLKYLETPLPGPAAARLAPKPAPVEPALAVDVSAEALGQFAVKVQPILMNACAKCHGNGEGGSFQLTPAFGNSGRAVRDNLTAVLAQINLQEPKSSPLLTKAVSVHGPMGRAPLSGKQMPAYYTMEEWVRLALAGPHGHTAAAQEASLTPPPVPRTDFAAVLVPDARPEADKAARPDVAQQPKTVSKPATAPTAQPVVNPTDPFDPAVFNKQNHPEP
jgi:mono/diheme cytochrome c family protein